MCCRSNMSVYIYYITKLIYYITKLLIITYNMLTLLILMPGVRSWNIFSLSVFFSLFIFDVHFIKKYVTFLPSDVNLVVYICSVCFFGYSFVHFIKKYVTFLPSDVNLVVYICRVCFFGYSFVHFIKKHVTFLPSDVNLVVYICSVCFFGYSFVHLFALFFFCLFCLVFLFCKHFFFYIPLHH